jgi:hypothetical protein
MLRNLQLLRSCKIMKRNIGLTRISLQVRETDLTHAIRQNFPEAKITVADASNGCGTNFEIEVQLLTLQWLLKSAKKYL